MQKTLGGDRLGSGKKMKVELHNYGRSTHDLGYLWRSSMASGTLVPFLCEVGLPGDTFDINLNCDIKTHPTIGPLFGSYKIQLDVFEAPMRLYNSLLHNNALGIGMNMKQVYLPQMELTATKTTENTTDFDNTQINPSCLLSYLGIRGVGTVKQSDTADTRTRQFNATAVLAYWEIYKQYYSNKQEEIGAVIHTPNDALVETVDMVKVIQEGNSNEISESPAIGAIDITAPTTLEIDYTGTIPIPNQIMLQTNQKGWISIDEISQGGWIDDGTRLTSQFNAAYGTLTILNWRYKNATDIGQGKPIVATFPLVNIDEEREAILAFNSKVAPYIMGTTGNPPYTWLTAFENDIPNSLSNQEGLAIKTYQSDLLNNWILTEWIDGSDGISQITAIDTSGGSFTLDTLNLSKKVYDMLNRIAVSGGTYDDWLDVTYTNDRYIRCETPMYHGGLIKELVFSELVSNTETETQPLGTLAGKGVMAKKHKGGSVVIKVNEPSYIIGLISITPRIDYSQGNKWDVHLQTIDDLHKPALDEIGFQELITEQMAWFDTYYDITTTQWIQNSAGKQPAWLNYMTNINQTRGNFAIETNEMFMTLNRRFEFDTDNENIKDITTYIDPSKFNFIFAESNLDAQNFWAQVAVDITARRKMSAKVMPNL